MSFSRSRYVTMCQQLLVTAAVLAVGLSAAGVLTLQIVTPTRPAADPLALAPAGSRSPAATRPVAPKVEQIAVHGIDAAARRALPDLPPTARVRGAVDRLAALSAPEPVTGYATVGVTWKPGTQLAEDQIAVQVRTLKDGAWSDWSTLAYHDDHGPDPSTREAARQRPGTDPIVIGDVDQVQMKAETADGSAPADLQLALINPGTAPLTEQQPAIDTAQLPASDAAATGAPIERTGPASGPAASLSSAATSSGAIALSAMSYAPKPTIYSRAQWGADESLRDPGSLRYGTIQTGFIHHTVNANDYTRSQVPALIRGIYAYHTQVRGWSDIGYNFLVDRFGRIWEGRYGGVDRPVVGAHTLGYNEVSFAMSAIGNFEIAKPPQAVLDAYARLYAWKLSLYDIKADAAHLTVRNTDLYAINGHRDVGATACPGKYLYARIPDIRTAARAIQVAAQDPVNLPTIWAPAGVPSPTQTPGPAPDLPTLTQPKRMSIAGNRWPDLLTKDQDGFIQVSPGAGMFGFRNPKSTGGPWGQAAMITGIGNVVGDSRPDLLTKERRTGIVRIYPGLSRGHFATDPAVTLTDLRRLRMISGGFDFDGDGQPDLIGVDRRTGYLVLVRGLGGGAFADPVTLRTNWPYVRTAMAGDMDGDGRTDLVALRDNGSLWLISGGGGATPRTAFVGRQDMVDLGAGVSGLVAGGDVTGDGHADVLVRSAGSTRLYTGAGDGTLTLDPRGPFHQLRGLNPLASMVYGRLLTVVGVTRGGTLQRYSMNRRHNLGAPLPTNLQVKNASQIIDVGDWDGDGHGDLITRRNRGDKLVLWPGLGNGKFGQSRSLGGGWRPIHELTAVGDITGDGYPDLVGRTSTGPWTIFPGAGLNAFKAPVLAPASLLTYMQIGRDTWSPDSGQLLASTVWFRGFVPTPGMDPATAMRTANGSVPPDYDYVVGVGDVDGDGVADVLAREEGTGVIWLLPGKTSGGFWPRMWVADGYAGYQRIG